MRNFVVLIGLLFINCNQKDSQLSTICKLPKKLKEVSGMQWVKDRNFFYVIQDSGNGSFLYEIGLDGKEIKNTLIGVGNIDWEDLASDKEGNLYFGDFGNNDNDRKNLCIYKVSKSAIQDDTMMPLPEYKVSFYYPEQTEFPPLKKEFLYDCEAFLNQMVSFICLPKIGAKVLTEPL